MTLGLKFNELGWKYFNNKELYLNLNNSKHIKPIIFSNRLIRCNKVEFKVIMCNNRKNRQKHVHYLEGLLQNKKRNRINLGDFNEKNLNRFRIN